MTTVVEGVRRKLNSYVFFTYCFIGSHDLNVLGFLKRFFDGNRFFFFCFLAVRRAILVQFNKLYLNEYSLFIRDKTMKINRLLNRAFRRGKKRARNNS